MTHRINPFLWLSELNFFNMTQGNELFFFFQIWLKVFSLKNQRIEFFFSIFLKELIFLWLEGLDFFYDAKNWTLFLWIWRKELNFLSYATQRIEPSSYLPQRIELFSQYDSKNWTFFFAWLTELNLFLRKVTHRIEPFLFFWLWLKELNFFSIWLKELNLFLSMMQRIEPVFFFFLNTTQWIDPIFLIWLNELNLIWHDSKNWFFFFEKMTQRIEISWAWRKELNPFFLVWLKEFAKKRTFISLIWMTPRIVFF